MNLLTYCLLTIALTVTCQSAEPLLVKLEGGLSPNGKFEAFLSGTRSGIVVKDHETSYLIGGKSYYVEDEGKEFYLVDIGFTECLYSDPPTKDLQNDSVTVSWSPNSEAVAIMWNVHSPSSCSVMVLNDRGVFVEQDFPSYQEMTGYPSPKHETLIHQKSVNLSSSSFVEWTNRGTFVYNIKMLPEPGFQGEDPLNHIVELTIDPLESKAAPAEKREN
ncbi:MAG: hypothetical protein P1U86_17600 [Verrucomicrobiales bacterium]|nr:hypothetical protein [Verrucomicrobiales bacterium]